MGFNQSHWATKRAVPPPNHLESAAVGDWVQVFEPYWNEITWWGQVVAVIPAETKPDQAALAPLWEVNDRSHSTSRQANMPKLKSKHPRIVVRKPNSLRVQAFALGGTTHYVYPRKCGYCQSTGFAPSKHHRHQCEFCDGTEGGQHADQR